MTVKTQITFREYLKLNIDILFEDIFIKLSLIFSFVFCILIFISNIFYQFNFQNFLIGIAILLFLIGILIFKYFQLKNIYRTNKNIGKETICTFSNEGIIIKAATFESIIKWETIIQIKELKSLFLIYYDSKTKSFIPKKDFTKEQISELRNIIKNSGVKASLRKD